MEEITLVIDDPPVPLTLDGAFVEAGGFFDGGFFDASFFDVYHVAAYHGEEITVVVP